MKTPCCDLCHNHGTPPAEEMAIKFCSCACHPVPSPILPPSFTLGIEWTSHDGGKTWTQYPPAERQWRGGTHATVVAIDRELGEIVVKVSR